jgi:hypothetical protein
VASTKTRGSRFDGINQKMLLFSRLHARSPRYYKGILTGIAVPNRIRSLSSQTKRCQVLPGPRLRAKTSRIYGRNIPLSRRPSYSSPRRSTRRMPFPQEKTCDYDLTYDFCAIHKKGMNTRTCRVSLKAPLHDFRHRRDPLVSPKTTAVLNKSKIRQRFRNLYPD